MGISCLGVLASVHLRRLGLGFLAEKQIFDKVPIIDSPFIIRIITIIHCIQILHYFPTST